MLPQEEEKEEGEMPMLGKETHYWMDTWARVAQEVRVNGICENSVLTCLRKICADVFAKIFDVCARQ